MVHGRVLSAPGAGTTLRSPALCWTARCMTATQRRQLRTSPRERMAWGVPRPHLVPSWENTYMSPRALPTLAEAEEGALPRPWRSRSRRREGTGGAYATTPIVETVGCRAARRRGGADRLHL